MSPSRKAALFSGLIYPGAGHLLLKKYWLGAFIIAIFSSGLFLVISPLITQAEQIKQQIVTGVIPPTVEAITKALSMHPSGDNAQLLSLVSYALVIIWAAALCHAYHLGKLFK